MPVSEKYNEYAEKVAEQLNRLKVRTIVDDRNEKIGRKVRDNELKRIPYMLVVGEKEAADGTVSIRKQGEGEQGTLSILDFGKKINDEVFEMLNANKLDPSK